MKKAIRRPEAGCDSAPPSPRRSEESEAEETNEESEVFGDAMEIDVGEEDEEKTRKGKNKKDSTVTIGGGAVTFHINEDEQEDLMTMIVGKVQSLFLSTK